MAELTPDQKRLLILISSFTKPARKRDEEETWIKKIPLHALINRGIQLGIFKDYDFAPSLVDYMGTTRYANVSKEGEDDVADLREEGHIERLKLATSHHVYVSAYMSTIGGVQLAKTFEKPHHDAVNKVVKCKCGSPRSIDSREDAPYLLCKKCGSEEKVAIFDIRELAYESGTVFPAIWPPPDTTK